MLLLIENPRYIEYIEQVTQLTLRKKTIETSFGILEIYEDIAHTVSVIEIGIQEQIRKFSDITLAVLTYLQESGIKEMGLLCKAGGINSLLRVGDIAFLSDYLDFTKCERYPFELRGLSASQRDMSEPFSRTWAASCLQNMNQWRQTYNTNIFSSATAVCTQGPLFETNAEIEAFRTMKMDIVAHSICPYVYYAKALNIKYLVLTVISNVYGPDSAEFCNDAEHNMMIAKLAYIMMKSARQEGQER